MKVTHPFLVYIDHIGNSGGCVQVLVPVAYGQLLLEILGLGPVELAQHLRHHLSGAENSLPGINASVRPISSPVSSEGVGSTGPGSRTTQTSKEESAKKVKVYVIKRWMVKRSG